MAEAAGYDLDPASDPVAPSPPPPDSDQAPDQPSLDTCQPHPQAPDPLPLHPHQLHPQAPDPHHPQPPDPHQPHPQAPDPHHLSLTPQVYLPKSVMRSAERDKDTTLHTACLTGSYDQVLMLLLSGHDPCPTNVWRETPLHHCTSRGHLDIMMLLLDASALVNATDHQGLTPLHQAIIHGNKEACELLLCYGASIHGGEGVKEGTVGVEGVNNTRSPLELASHVHVCHNVIESASGKVWSLQHTCRIIIRKNLGPSKRRRLKELPLPPHLIAFLSTLPISCSEELHANWERRRSSKSEVVRKRGEARRKGAGREGKKGGLHLLRQLHHPHPRSS